jgi:hypothetical protein
MTRMSISLEHEDNTVLANDRTADPDFDMRPGETINGEPVVKAPPAGG